MTPVTTGHATVEAVEFTMTNLPSATWRIWTSLGHFPFIAKTFLFGSGRESLVNVSSIRAATDRHGLVGAIKEAISHPLVAHGGRGTAANEIGEFRRSRWIAEFSQNGFEVLDASPLKVFYTGYGLIPKMRVTRRRILWFSLTCICDRRQAVVTCARTTIRPPAPDRRTRTSALRCTPEAPEQAPSAVATQALARPCLRR